MKKVFIILLLMGVVFSSLSCFCSAEDLASMTDKFYNGLAGVIEGNMDDPDKCLSGVNSYYQKNQALISRIQEETEKALEKVAPKMAEYIEKYESMSEEELAELERKSSQQQEQRQASPGVERYSKALQAFSMKYPQEGMMIALKAMELFPAEAAGSGY